MRLPRGSRLAGAPRPGQRTEDSLALQLRALLPPREQPVRQHPVLGSRKWVLDFAWPGRMLAVEVDGGVHRISDKFRRDLERHNVLQVLGWRVLRFSPADVRSGRAALAVEAVFAGDLAATLATLQGKEHHAEG